MNLMVFWFSIIVYYENKTKKKTGDGQDYLISLYHNLRDIWGVYEATLDACK